MGWGCEIWKKLIPDPDLGVKINGFWIRAATLLLSEG
jgi:hypothetical protein